MSSFDDHDCADCPSRRTFLHLGLGGAMALGAAFAADLARLPIVHGTPLFAAGTELTYPVPAGDSVTIDSENQVILVRSKNIAYAFNLACPHQNTALRWRQADNRFQCPRHESKYQADGTFISGRATRNMDRLAIRREGDSLIVDTSKMYRSDQNAAGWAAAAVQLS